MKRYFPTPLVRRQGKRFVATVGVRLESILAAPLLEDE